ncbi:hypothetical protein N7537_008094 [Penicillium hordei]|uniref:FAD-binding domain-containing protein n=1 Tax=Penicillium hordei TaxID=40994 RepID=A0AAD6GY48_9EURO|nr:uncharacterized protein N7537_008094 [Penicillium hordei]KAJ5598010.1 hypothetical protein N7537_008094 [Penicillium hordei]
MTPHPAQFLAGKRIIVAGGSFAALSFVLALDQLWNSSLDRPAVIIYEKNEREKCLEKDPYILNINGASRDDGLVAIQQLGILDEVLKHASRNGGDIRVWGDDWKWLSSMNPEKYGNLPAATIRISREELKRILLEKAEVKQKAFKWGWACMRAEQTGDGTMRVTVSNDGGKTTSFEQCDLLIAADGANSELRACFRSHDMKTTYMGASQIGGVAYLKDGVPKPIDEDYGLQMDHGVCCIYNPFDRNRVAWALSMMGPARETKTNLNEGDFKALKNEALETGRVFKEPFKSVVEATVQDTAFIRPATTKDAFQHDERLEGVMFIGDANHILSPYEFVGANLALKDGWDLAEQICRHTSMKAAAASYDAISIPRFNHPFTFQNERVRFGHADGWKWSAYKVGMKAQRMSKTVH